MSKYLDQSGVSYLWGKIKSLVGTKVDKVEGKGLSQNDFTDTEKTKLAGLENYTLPSATAESLGGVKVGDGLEINDGVLSATGGGEADSVAWDNITGKPELALKSDITNIYTYKGSVTDYDALPTEDNSVGDVWDVADTGMNYGWTGTGWDALGTTFDIESITNAEIDSITDATDTEGEG